ncbi:hypothetical protein PG993_015004 [Apiospora rasikravindrae]|uniref:AAA+ ATPase domain-containing protein n=1 Tax=Apiospora rasikravindrae TaxID=990691 RepID=A0ABR1RPC9_9PEZI
METNRPVASPEAVHAVMSARGTCGRFIAEQLLRNCDNDVEKAIIVYDRYKQKLQLLVNNMIPRGRRPNAPSTASSDEVTYIDSDGETCVDSDVGSDSESDNEDNVDREWGFDLPRIPAPRPHLQNARPDGSTPFSLIDLIGAVQAGETVERIRNYLAFHSQGDGSELQHLISGTILGFPAFFYVVETRCPDLIRMWAMHGGDVHATYGPLRAVVALLALGASADVIPRAFFNPLERDLPNGGPPEKELSDLEDPNKRWCTPHTLLKLTQTLNFSFTTRYHLHLSSLLKGHTGAQRQVVQMRKSEDILGIPYFLIGQTTASTVLIKTMLRYLAMPTKRPIAMMFAGPSGHGKTELARKFGDLLNLPFHSVDCTSMKHTSDLFGARAPYHGHKEGSPLNNFLARNDGTRSIVFLDEFEKAGKDIRQALLIPLQDGTYQDRRDLSPVDCSKMVWIFATNAFDSTIHEFCRRNKDVIYDPRKMLESEKLMGDLSKDIRKESEGHFGVCSDNRPRDHLAPLPDLLPLEQAVVADKYVSDFGLEAVRPVQLARDRLVGDVNLHIRQGWSLCSALARTGYVPELGARSLAAEVDERVRGPLVDAYLQNGDEIAEGGGWRSAWRLSMRMGRSRCCVRFRIRGSSDDVASLLR